MGHLLGVEFFDYSAESYTFAAFAFQRLLAALYLVAFLVAYNQFPALQGERGLEPVVRHLGPKHFFRSPSVFQFHYSDRFFRWIAALGIVLSLFALSGYEGHGSIALSMLVWFVLWALYQSINNIGGTFWGYGWETKLLDVGFLAIFVGPGWMETPLIVVFLLRWLLLRVELGAGLIKMRGDSCWRDLTCMRYHHETQPIPNPLSWYFHHASTRWHKVETLGNHIVQLGVIWFVFLPQPIASIAGALIIVTQLWLVQSGNYSWLNFLTICAALPTISDQVISVLFGWTPPDPAPSPLWFERATYVLAGLTAVLSVPVVKNLASKNQLMNRSYNPLHIVSTYGAFGSVSRERHEVIIDGTRDENPGSDALFLEYQMKAKPGDPSRRPRQVAPYHLRLDWQLWFVPLRPFGQPRWLLSFVRKLLENDRATLSLISHNPFEDAPPRWIRISMYRYRYTTPEERRQSGHWWVREYLGEYLPPVCNGDLEQGTQSTTRALRL